MRAAAFTEFAGVDGIEIIELPTPKPGPGEAVVDVEASALNRHDLSLVQGIIPAYDEDDLPFVSGLDAAGTVQSVGDGVPGVEPGDRVLICPIETCGACRFCSEGPENLCSSFSIYHGGFAESALVDAERLIPLPASIDTTTAAALPTAYMTAYHMLRKARVGPTDLVFIPGVTGGVGVAGVQLAEVLAARTVGTSSSAAKLDRVADLGLDHPIEGTDPDELREAVGEIGRIDAVLNHLGGAYTRLGLDVLDRNGRMAVCGRTTGITSEIHLGDLFINHKRIIGSTMGTQSDLETLLYLVASGDLDPAIGDTFAFEETRAAFEALEDRSLVGKIVVTH